MTGERPPSFLHIEPRRFGRYTLHAMLPEGGSGQLYIAQKDGSTELCVLKHLRVELRSNDTASQRIQREAHLAAFLQHGNIARVIDAGVEKDIFYLATELIAGQELSHLLDKHAEHGTKLSPEVTIKIALDVLAGIEYAHQATDPQGKALDLVHRDISPRNVMLGFDGSVKIIDFGAARGNVGDFKSLPGTVIGTPRYISPEIVRAQEVDRRTDLYSFSVLLFEMLTGDLMVPPGDFAQVLTWIIQKAPPRLRELDPTLPPALDDVLAKGLEKEPAKRWQNATDLKNALVAATRSIRPASKVEIGRIMRQYFPEEHNMLLALMQKAAAQVRVERRSALSMTADDMPRFASTTADLHEDPTRIEHDKTLLDQSLPKPPSIPPDIKATNPILPVEAKRTHALIPPDAKITNPMLEIPKLPERPKAPPEVPKMPAPVVLRRTSSVSDRGVTPTPAAAPKLQEPSTRGWVILACLALALVMFLGALILRGSIH
jgi:serine/threonine protein kinase